MIKCISRINIRRRVAKLRIKPLASRRRRKRKIAGIIIGCYFQQHLGLIVGIKSISTMALADSAKQGVLNAKQTVSTQSLNTKKIIFIAASGILIITTANVILSNVQLRKSLHTAGAKIILAKKINKRLDDQILTLRGNVTSLVMKSDKLQDVLASVFNDPAIGRMLACESNPELAIKYTDSLVKIIGGKEVMFTNGGQMEIIKLLCAIQHIATVGLVR